MPLQATERYQFGPFRMDSDERLLYRGDELIALTPKVAGTLLALVQNSGRIIEKGDLMKAVWPDSFVEEGALTRNISLLRKTLGDTGEDPAFIETIPKRGYRFIASVSTTAAPPAGVPVANPRQTAAATEDAQSDPEPQPPPPSPRVSPVRYVIAGILFVGLIASVTAVTRYAFHDKPSPVVTPITNASTILAVLPFRSIEANDSQEYFADGITQALITSLAHLGKLRVVSLASEADGQIDTAAWNTILQNRSVRRVLTGTVMRSAGRVRVDAQLINPATKEVMWANSYDRDIQDFVALEAALSVAIAGEIQGSITAEDRDRLRPVQPVKPEALDAYLRGRYFWNRRSEDGLRRAAQYFQQAIDLDPGYALAYSGLADSYSLLGSIGTDGMAPNRAMPLAKAAAEKALALDPKLADAHISLAYVRLSYDWDLAGAAQEFSRGLTLNPNSATGRHWYSHYFMAAGDLPKAAEQMGQALELEPLSPSINIGVGWCLYYSRQYDKAIERFRLVAEMEPSLPLAHQTLGMAYQQKGWGSQAIEEFKRATALSGDSPPSVAALASAYATAGRLPEARRELALLEQASRTRYVPAFYFAMIHYAMGDLTKTFEWGWKAVDERCDYLMYLRVEPQVGKLAVNPEFMRAMAGVHKQ